MKSYKIVFSLCSKVIKKEINLSFEEFFITLYKTFIAFIISLFVSEANNVYFILNLLMRKWIK